MDISICPHNQLKEPVSCRIQTHKTQMWCYSIFSQYLLHIVSHIKFIFLCHICILLHILKQPACELCQSVTINSSALAFSYINKAKNADTEKFNRMQHKIMDFSFIWCLSFELFEHRSHIILTTQLV